jgi:hypothetical protein
MFSGISGVIGSSACRASDAGSPSPISEYRAPSLSISVADPREQAPTDEVTVPSVDDTTQTQLLKLVR